MKSDASNFFPFSFDGEGTGDSRFNKMEIDEFDPNDLEDESVDEEEEDEDEEEDPFGNTEDPWEYDDKDDF